MPGNIFLTGADARRGDGEIASTFARFMRLIDQADPATRVNFGWFLTNAPHLHPSVAVDRALVQALDEAWITPDHLALPTIRYLAKKWPRALGGVSAPGEPELLQLLRDPVLLSLLQATPAATPGVDMLLARFRNSALRAVLARQDLGSYLPTVAMLAVRGWYSHYALTLPAFDRDAEARTREPTLTAELREQIECGERDGSDHLAAALVLACYGPPSEEIFKKVAADPLARIVTEKVAEPRLRQREIATTLPSITPIDPSSRIVASQYEAHPYPAWARIGDDLPEIPDAVRNALRGRVEPVRSVLVAGCRTGRHAVGATRNWPSADILAVDLSRTSLAYAVERTAEAGLQRLSFAQADLLKIAAAGRRFQVIEAFGVLHHLQCPEAGLAALRDVLEPGGIMGIGLYASGARSELANIRRRYGKGTARNDDDVRDFRAWALVEERDSPFLLSPDFYSIGGCRDAFFHVREKGYTLPEVARLLDSAKLRLLAIQAPPESQHLPGPLPGPTDLAGWAAAEQRHPKLFISMYEFWVQALE